MAKSVVSITKGTDAQEMISEALELLGGVKSLIKPGSVVVVKPNAGHPYPPEASVNTSPAVVAAAIKILRKARPREIILAESAATGCDTLECLELSGIGKAAEDAGVDRIIDIKREKDLIKVPIRDARADVTKVLLPRFLLEADHLVNLPIFKSHVTMVFTCALKNLKGVVQDTVHYQMHQTDLAVSLMDLWSVCRADLSIADLIRPSEGFGPHTGLPTDFGCIAASQDPVALDATICRMVGLDTSKVAYFAPACERGIGNFAEEHIEIRGRQIKEVFKQLWLPYLGGFEQWPEYHIYAEGACSSCQALLGYTMERLKAVGEYEHNAGISIVLGRTKSLPENVKPRELILMGNCVKKFRDQGFFIEGCPPLEPFPSWVIIDREEYFRRQAMKLDSRAHMAERGQRETEMIIAYMKRMKEKAESGGKKGKT
jgi:uncharacterized protein (DUF362 family)